MRYSLWTFFAIGMIQLSTVIAAPASLGLPGNHSGLNSALDPLTVTTENLALTSISYVDPGTEIVSETLDYRVCQVAVPAGIPLIAEPGAPVVPRITRMYRIPELGGVDLVIRNSDYEVLENHNPLPYPANEAGSMRYEQDPAFYLRDAWYPENVVEISEPSVFRDFRIVTVTINPVQVNPVSHQARIYSNIEVDIVANSQPGVNELLHPRRPSGAFESMFQGFIRNLDERALDEVTTTPGTYLILARDNEILNPWVDSLAEWRTRCGFDVAVERFATQPVASTMLATIQEYYENSETPLEHVCIVGDPSGSFAMPTESSGLMDHYFARLAGADYLPDISIGRLSVSTELEMATVWSKIVIYERNPLIDSTNWFTKSLLYAITGNEEPTNLLEVQWADQQLRYFTGFQNNTISSSAGQSNSAFIQGQFNSGIGLFLYAGYWLGTLQDIATGCWSGARQPICILMAGATGQFADNFCRSESFVMAGTPTSPRGGVAAIGFTSANENGPFFRTFGIGFIRGLCPLQIERVGLCQLTGFLTILETFASNSQFYINRLSSVNLIGDPALRIWTDIPTTMRATHPTQLAVGARELVVTVTDSLTEAPVSNALVVAWKPGDTLVRVLTDSAGTAVMPVTIESSGTLKLTVTKQNCKPILADIPCQEAELHVAFESMAIDDDNIGGTSGNNDNNFNPGEVIDLNVVLSNFGSINIGTNVSAVLSSQTANVGIINSTSVYPDLLPGEQANGTSAFRIQVSGDMQNNAEGLLRLTSTAAGVEAISAIPIVCLAGEARYTTHVMDLPLDPGSTRDVTVFVANQGVLPLESVTGTLVSQSPLIAVTDNSGTFGDIEAGSTESNATDVFTLYAHPSAFRGHQSLMTLIIETTTGFHDTVSFIVSCGTATATDPTGPDMFGYYAYDDVDTTYALRPDFDYLDLSSGIGEDLNLDDPGEKTTVEPIFSVARALPFEFNYYDETFDSITICSNGWIAFGDESWCDEPFDRAIPAVMAPPNMVAVFWADLKTNAPGDGVWAYHDESLGAYIVQWKARGGTSYNQADLDFEVMLLDPAVHQSTDTNGKILLLYNDISMNLGATISYNDLGGCTIGIQDQAGSRGLQLFHYDQYAQGTAEIVDGRVILIETGERAVVGNIEGIVTAAESGTPLENVLVSIDGYNYQGTTDAQGFFRIESIVTGTYNVRAHRIGYNDFVATNIVVEFDSTETVSIDMLHPELALSRNFINDSLVEGATLQTSFDVINDGDGPLEYAIEIAYTIDGEQVDPWDNLDIVDVSGETGDFHILGCEYANDHWYVSGASDIGGTNFIHAFDRDGNYTGSLQQPTSDPFGWFDMAWDGRYLYGSEQGSSLIKGIDGHGDVQETIVVPNISPVRAIAYDPGTDHFWVADMTSDIYEIDRAGNPITTIENLVDIAITGLAWHSTEVEGFNLFLFSQDDTNTGTEVWRVQPASSDFEFVADVSEDEDDRAGGCTITSEWNSALVVLGAIIQHPSGDRIGIYDVEFNLAWIDIDPSESTVEAGQREQVLLSIDGANLRPDLYQFSILINCPVLDLTAALPVELNVIPDGVPAEQDPVVPARYALHQNYPNPFNPSTSLSYDLKSSGQTELKIFNVVGQEVATLVNESQDAGNHVITFRAHDLPSGIYFYRLKSGTFTKTAKMVLLK